jgi:hypothetical protein
MGPESLQPKNTLDDPEIQEILEKYGDQPIVYPGKAGEEAGTVRDALGDARCPLKHMLVSMPFETQEVLIRQFIRTEG